MSIGSPTPRFDRMVESIETRLTLRASYSSVVYLTARSRIGLPYLCSPIWRNGVSLEDSMKFPAE